jgi:hypothetical protein
MDEVGNVIMIFIDVDGRSVSGSGLSGISDESITIYAARLRVR